MTVLELIIAFALGIATMASIAWLAGAKRKTLFLFFANSILAGAILTACSQFFGTVFRLNAFNLYISGFFGIGGLLVSVIVNYL